MSMFKSALQVGFTLIQDETEYGMQVGSPVEITAKFGPKEETVSGVVAGCSVKRARSANRTGHIYDGIPTNQFHTDAMANVKNVEKYYVVDKIIVNVEPEAEEPKYVNVPVECIVALNGTFVNADGSVLVAAATAEDVIAAVAELADGTTVKVNADVALEAFLSVGGEGAAVLDLNGHEIVRESGTALYVNSDAVVLDIKGAGTIKGTQAVFGQAGTINIHDGRFENAGEQIGDCIYAKGTAQINIYGGEFHAQLCEGAFAEPQHSCLNIYDSDKATASIKVYGGTFYNFDPANNVSENPRMSFVAEGYKSVEKEPGVFEVVVDESYVAPEEQPEETPEETPAE